MRTRAPLRGARRLGLATLVFLAPASCLLVTDLDGLSSAGPVSADAGGRDDAEREAAADSASPDADAIAADAVTEGGADGGAVTKLPRANVAFLAVLGVPTDDAGLYVTYIDDSPAPNDDADYVRSRGGATTNQFITVAYDPLVGGSARSVDVTFRAQKTPMADCTPAVDLMDTKSSFSMTKTAAPLVTGVWTTQTLHFDLGTVLVEPEFTTRFNYNNPTGNTGQCLLTSLSITISQ